VSYYYIRPDCVAQLPYTNGIDYFSSEDEVFHYVKSTVSKRRAQLQGEDHKILYPPEEAEAQPFRTSKRPHNSSKTIKNIDSKKNSLVENSTPPHVAVAATSSTAAPVLESCNELVDVMQAEWKVVWKILRAKGWTWAFGKATSSWHVMPGELRLPK